MLKKLILALVMTAFCTVAFADSCPSVKDIKNNSLHGWKAYDSDDDTPLSSARFAAYAKSLEQFTLAEWKKGSKNSTSIHCFYRDSNGSALEAYLAKDNLSPTLGSNSTKDQWYQVSGSLNCAASPEDCKFQSSLSTKQPQLATR